MQFSENWLRSLVNPPLSSAELGHLLTMAGLELEEMNSAAAEFSKVVVAKVLTVEKHPNADKLSLCTVNAGGETLQIVCGAPNVAPGLKVPCALIGAELKSTDGVFEIKKAKMRGVESFGMLCSAKELGISEDSSGLMVLAGDAPIGADLRRTLALDDKIFTLKLTPNRADCLSLKGLAREVAALTHAPLSLPAIEAVPTQHQKTRAVVLDAPELCPRYCGRIVSGVNAAAPTPEWMKQRLERSGIRSISAIVDVTNYVLLEQGQPMHAFDNAKLEGAIHVRLPKSGEQLKLLNEQTIIPAADAVLIADEARALALGGIMGGDASGVTTGTTEIFLESAYFAPEAIAGKARELGFSSDASFRFERGVDFSQQRAALERATQLVLEICGGQPGPLVEAVSEAHLPERAPVKLRLARAAKVIGIDLGRERIEKLLRGLHLDVQAEADGFLVTPPPHRFDMEIEADLIEEIARIHGYDNIPAPAPTARLAMMPQSESSRSAMQVRRQVAERDYQEVVNFSFVEAAWEADFCGNIAPLTLANPIASQLSVMRISMIGGLINTLRFNLNRRTQRVRVFELGRCFLQEAAATQIPGIAQPLRLAALAAGPALPEQWGAPARNVDFFDLKADVEALFPAGSLQFEKAAHPALHPGRSANILRAGKVIGILGELHPLWVQKYETGTAPVVFEIEFASLQEQTLPVYKTVSRFPVVVRDLAFVVTQSGVVQTLVDALWQEAPAIVKEIKLFDLYQGKGLEQGKKSLAFRIVMQDTEKTLADVEVDAAIAQLIAAADKNGASLR